MTDLSKLQQQLQKQQSDELPLENWHPDFCGDIDMRIDHEGKWFYMGSPIGREALVKLFARVLWKEDDNYFLLTPVEKVGITVEDVPFIITDWQYVDIDGKQALEVTTIQGDNVVIKQSSQIECRVFQQNPIPYILIRRNLWARLHRNVYYQWIENATLSGNELLMQSGDITFSIGTVTD